MNAAAESVFATALAGLPGMGPARLRAALEAEPPSRVWRRVLEGDLSRPGRRNPAGGDAQTLALAGADDPGPPPGGAGAVRVGGTTGGEQQAWAAAAARSDLGAIGRRLRSSAVGVTWPGRPDYPGLLAGDPDPPGVLFWRGDLGVLSRPTVAVVGTRRCSPDGRRVAFELGRELAAAGVCVVSGLALGIDGEAHRGALSACRRGTSGAAQADGGGDGSEETSLPAGATVGVAASGVDVPYPRRHAGLWEEVVALGAVISETPPGHPAQAWRFPSRNRIIAALARIVVVVESFEAGGSMLTVDAALHRGVEVRAVPGAVHNPAAAGPNRLLVEGAAPVRHAGDVLDALGLGGAWGAVASADRAGWAPRSAAPLDGTEKQVLSAVGWAPTPLGRVMERTGLAVGAAGLALAQLEARHLVEGRGGWWVRLPVR